MYNHNKNDPISSTMEDYELWLRLTFGDDADKLDKPIKFYNLGQVLVHLRKHNANRSSGVETSVEVPLKMHYLTGLLSNHEDLLKNMLSYPEIVEEFIKVTGRPVRDDTFSSLKYRSYLVKVFDGLLQEYKQGKLGESLHAISKSYILKSLEDRK